jgi:putative tricarboxylic transport membrane protein
MFRAPNFHLSVIGGWSVVTGAALLLLVIPRSIPHPESQFGVISPRFLPIGAAWALLLIGLALVLQAFRAGRTPPNKRKLTRKDWTRLTLIGAALIGPPLLMNKIGYIVAMTITSVVAIVMTGERRLTLILAVGTSISVATWILFRWGLSVPLPAGVLM